MTSTSFRLLRGYLRRSAVLFAILGATQYLLDTGYWIAGIAREALPLALLGLWGYAASINAQSLVWRSLPLSARDASVFRWWAIVGAPSIFVTALKAITWADQHTWTRVPALPVPSPASLWHSALVGWAAVGVVAVLPAVGRRISGRFRFGSAAAFAIGYAAWLLYGLPEYSASPRFMQAFIAVGLIGLVYSCVMAVRGDLWRWPDVAIHRVQLGSRHLLWAAAPRFGVNAILAPLMRRTAGFALLATGGILALYRIFPHGGDLLFWSYFIAISTAGFLLTYQIRSAVQTLRLLPLSAEQLSLMLQFFGALPGFATLGLTLAVNGALLHVKLDPAEFAACALIVIASQALPLQPMTSYPRRPLFQKWIPMIQRIVLPVYLAIIVLHSGGAFVRWWWFKWPLVAAGIVLCFVGYYTLVHQLRAGIRPASGEALFSAR
jgi:hypothetical protein